MPKVSVLIPVYNAEKYLREAIDSILEQSFSDFELIIVNDFSTDGSEDIILSYDDKRIRYYKNEENIGILKTRRRLIESSTGKYIAYLDNDDLALPERLYTQVHFLDNNPDYALCGTWGTLIDANGNYLKKMNLTVKYEEIKCALLFANCFIQSSMMFRQEILVDNPYDINFPLAKDYNLWSLLALRYKVCNIPAHLIKYRWHQSNESKKKEDLMTSLTKKVYKRQLLGLGIDATEEELEIHNKIASNRNPEKMSDKEYFCQLRTWMKKLAEANKKTETYNKDMFLATICFRWIFACKERHAYPQILKLPVAPTIDSLKNLLKLLYDRTK
ncbi:glycosyltransferase family A protein [Dysgonomonas sp. 520]|uniref:glycosyltransferase family 2 protein n=1 Tax=Dysgonomonas sp. 520 TaxID=2302931 RepID=UPI0013D5D41E|nr:glycosyltransferase family A protein [Dysgonomonas sp. 520]NDW10853.1 glycosyltransferase family 2 protein [Dysgonomonas sp. 520]